MYTVKSLIVAAVFFLGGCANPFLFQENHTFSEPWKQKEKVDFTLEIKEPTLPYQCFIDLRHYSDFAYENFWIFITTKSPSNKYFSDTIELSLANKQGVWLGKSSSNNLISHHILFQKDFFFKEQGTYIFSIEHALREEQIKISDIGLSIQKGALR